jgi:hypothetical protein
LIANQTSTGKGSLKDVQILINRHPDLLNSELRSKIPLLQENEIDWLSPLKQNNYAK